MQVFLIGFMGAGKSSLGNRLSNRLGIQFIDMDQSIENQEGKTIDAIFSDEGEDHFRSIEKQWLNDLSNEENAVIALGGGAACSNQIMELLRNKGVPVYLKVSNGILVSRLMKAKTKRPIIDSFKNDKKAMTDFVSVKLSDREPYYLKAKIIFESSDINAEDLALLSDLILLSSM
jgi:shikimate kinase